MSDLTTLANVKTLLQIPSTDTTSDALLTLLIGATSSQIETWCNRRFGVADYVDNLPPSGEQILQLLNYPLNTVTSIVVQGTALTSSEYSLLSQFTPSGQIYKITGWFGPTAARGLTFDPYAPLIDIVVTYNAGYVLPGGSPVSGVADLPTDIQLVTGQMVAKLFGLSNIENLGENLVSLSEGSESYTLDNARPPQPELFSLVGGLPVNFAAILAPYRRWAVA